MKEPTIKNKKHDKCCCTCEHQMMLMKHPFNKGVGKGSITEIFGWVCKLPSLFGKDQGVFFSKKHGLCDGWEKKKI